MNSLEGVMLFLFLLSAAGCVVRYRRAGGVVRQQIKWFAYAGIVTAVGIRDCRPVSSQPVVAFIVLGPLVPVAAGIAIMKYRLYDIDVVISKTIVYGSLAAFITAVIRPCCRRDRLARVRFPARWLAAEPWPVDPGHRGGGGGLPAGQGTGAAPGQPAGVRQAGHPV